MNIPAIRAGALAAPPTSLIGLRETFSASVDGRALRRVVVDRSGRSHASAVRCVAPAGRDVDGADFDAAWLRSTQVPPISASGDPIRIADLFSGCGAMTLGAVEACRALGRAAQPVLAVDLDPVAVATYAANFPGALTIDASVTDLVGGRCGVPLSSMEREVRRRLGPLDLVVGGPPCQGHSNLNNHTRRQDPRNALLFRMARFAEVTEPTHVIIENVRDVMNDRGRVLSRTIRSLEHCGYMVDGGVIKSVKLGVPQTRVRYFLVASRKLQPSLSKWIEALATPARSVRWAIGDLQGSEGLTPFNSSSKPSAENTRRIGYLFDHDEHDLPDAQRPPCHRKGGHSYWAIYGRLWGDRPAPTLTTGFGSTGQGRNVHPWERRTITPHEAARLQFIPDFFRFGDLRRKALATLIGNAVPPKVAYALALNLLG